MHDPLTADDRKELSMAHAHNPLAPTPPRLDRREFLGSCTAGIAAMAAWPALGQAAASPKAAPTSPLAMWALTGTLKSEDVCRQLDAFAAVGWGVVLYPRWGLELEYLGEAWFERIRFIVEQAAARKIEVWLYDEFCWPSGHAKGLVTKGHEELTAQLLYVERDGHSRIDRVPGSANLLMREATERFLSVTHERYAAAVGNYFGTTVRAIFTDEPSLAMQHQPRKRGDKSWRLLWSDSLGRRLGGDFRERLARAGSDVAKSPLWRDYWAAYAGEYYDAWTAPIARWCESHKIAMSGHLLGENSFGSHVGNYGSLRRQLAAFDLPGIDEISTRTDVEKCEALTLATIAELAGRERMVEVFALGPPHMRLETMRKMIDLCASCGVDRYVLAICPHDFSGNVTKREYLGVHSFQQPWFRDYAKLLTSHVAEAAERARKAQPLGVSWPSDEQLWNAAGPDPLHSAPLAQLTKTFADAAREAIRARLTTPTVADSSPRKKLEAPWTFEPVGLNSLRVDGPMLTVVDLPSVAELSVQRQLVQSLRINGVAVDLAGAPADRQFDLSYCRVSVAKLLRAGENTIEIGSKEAKPLRFLPAVILWGNFAVDAEGRLTALSKTIRLGDWRRQGYPALCGTGRYRATVDFASVPTRLGVDSGGYPVQATVNGRPCGQRAWAPFTFDLRGAARAGRNEIVLEITSTVGHLFVPTDSPPVGLLDVWSES
jgi:hypothetical protein